MCVSNSRRIARVGEKFCHRTCTSGADVPQFGTDGHATAKGLAANCLPAGVESNEIAMFRDNFADVQTIAYKAKGIAYFNWARPGVSSTIHSVCCGGGARFSAKEWLGFAVIRLESSAAEDDSRMGASAASGNCADALIARKGPGRKPRCRPSARRARRGWPVGWS